MSAPPTIIINGSDARQKAARWAMAVPLGSVVTYTPPKRTPDQNSKLHAMITDVAEQVEWAGKKLGVEAWKDIFTAALRSSKNALDVVPGLNGGFVLLGMHTSQMTKAEMIDLIELIYAFGAEHDVKFGGEPDELVDQPSAEGVGA